MLAQGRQRKEPLLQLAAFNGIKSMEGTAEQEKASLILTKNNKGVYCRSSCRNLFGFYLCVCASCSLVVFYVVIAHLSFSAVTYLMFDAKGNLEVALKAPIIMTAVFLVLNLLAIFFLPPGL